MKKREREAILELIPTLIPDIQYESDLIQILTGKYGYRNIRIGDVRKLLSQLNITLNADSKKEKEVVKKEPKKRERRILTKDELLKKSEDRKVNYQDVITLLISKDHKFSYRDIANICNDLNIDFDNVAQNNINKINARAQNNTLHGNGDNR